MDLQTVGSAAAPHTMNEPMLFLQIALSAFFLSFLFLFEAKPYIFGSSDHRTQLSVKNPGHLFVQ